MKKFKLIKRIGKIFGLCLGGLVVTLGLVLAGYWIAGAFNPPNVPLTGIAVNELEVASNSYFTDGKLVINDDSTFKIAPIPEDGTEKIVSLHLDSGNDVISVPETGEIGKEIAITVLKDENGKIKGGEAKIKISTESLWSTYLNIFVDIPVEDITLTNNAPVKIYPGNTFTVSVASFSPAKSKNPSNISQSTNKDKEIVFYSTNTNVATVNETTGVVSVIADGTFKIGARVFKTYYDELNQPNESDYEYPEDYLLAIASTSVSKETNLFTSNDIEISSISTTGTTQNITLLTTVNKTISDLSISLEKPLNSNFTTEQINLKKYDLEIVGGKINGNEITIDNNFIEISKSINKQNIDGTTFSIKVNSYVSPSSNPCLVVTFKELLYDAEGKMFSTLITGDLIKTIPVAINKTDVSSLKIKGNEPENEDSSDIVLELNVGTYNLNESYSLLPNNSTYKKVMFFAKAQTADSEVISVDTTKMVEINGGIHYLISYKNDTTTFDSIIKTLNVGTVQIYAVVVKTNINGEPLKANKEGEHFEYLLDFSSPVSNVTVVEKINSIVPVVKDGTLTIEKTGDVYILAKDQVVSLDLFANITGTLPPDATPNNSSKILTDAFKYGLLTFSSSASNYLSVNAKIESDALKIELSADAKVSQVSLLCFYKELGSENNELMFQLTFEIMANTISRLNLTANGSLETTINATINENSKSINWDSFSTSLAVFPSNLSAGNVIYKCTMSNVINESQDSASTSVLSISYSDGEPVYTFKKAGEVYIYATTINSEGETINSNLVKVIVKTPTISITTKSGLSELNFEELAGKTFNILSNVKIQVTPADGTGAYESDTGSILDATIIQNFNDRATINGFDLYLGQVAKERIIKIKLSSQFDQEGKIITLTIMPDVKAIVAYPGGLGYEVVYSGTMLDLLNDKSITTTSGNVARVQITDNLGNELITKTKEENGTTEYVYDVGFSFNSELKAKQVINANDVATLVVEFLSVSFSTDLTISVNIDLTPSAEVNKKEIFSVNYVVLIKPSIKITNNFGEDKYEYNGKEYLNIFSGCSMDLSKKLSFAQIATENKSGTDMRGNNYSGNIVQFGNDEYPNIYNENIKYSIKSTSIGTLSQDKTTINFNENSVDKSISLSENGEFSSSTKFIEQSFSFVVLVNCGNSVATKEINILYIPFNITLNSAFTGNNIVNANSIIDVINDYVEVSTNSTLQTFTQAFLKSKITLSLASTGLTDVAIENYLLKVGANPTIGVFTVRASYGINYVDINFEIKA